MFGYEKIQLLAQLLLTEDSVFAILGQIIDQFINSMREDDAYPCPVCDAYLLVAIVSALDNLKLLNFGFCVLACAAPAGVVVIWRQGAHGADGTDRL